MHWLTKVCSLLMLVITFGFLQGCSKMELIGGRYYKQGNKIIYAENGDNRLSYFFKGHKGVVEGADVDSFVYLGLSYAKDMSHVYFKDGTISVADRDSFEIIGEYFAKDKNHIFRGGRFLKGVDVKTFQRLGEYDDDETGLKNYSIYYSRDKNHVFYQDTILIGADPDTFKSWERKGQDKLHEFWHGYMRDENGELIHND
ncbi:MAG: Unknown protein [uncultured Sulfurovum sp.]|uniref:DKNYY family protein n=1 Tax=uncultured Sulfurovum sp. TaxID=269237 RepID=A0A6S6SAG9_9BACT|nr:MAG: Unknown protein [uncultured Sulfurovum sp.]